jgi:hypothetical protein
VAQFVMVVQILIAERNGEDALADQCLHLMLDQLPVVRVHEATGKTVDQSDRAVRQPQQKRPGIRGDRSAVKTGHNRALFDRCKIELFRYTLCLHRGTSLLRVSLCSRSIFPDSEPRCTSIA